MVVALLLLLLVVVVVVVVAVVVVVVAAAAVVVTAVLQCLMLPDLTILPTILQLTACEQRWRNSNVYFCNFSMKTRRHHK